MISIITITLKGIFRDRVFHGIMVTACAFLVIPVIASLSMRQVSELSFRLDITGAVDHPASWNFAQFKALPQSDFVTLLVNLSPETRGLINAGTMALLPDGAHIINVARGGVADQPALIAALQSGRLGGAYLDVFEQEPLPPESPLWNLPNVIVSPHNASASAGNEGRAADVFAANLVKWSRGETLLNERAA